jgi:branched-chain amino acid transport system substrate-binding protein
MTLASEGGTNKAVENSISIVFLKDPIDAKWRSDAAVKLYRSIMSRFAAGANQKDVYHVYGMAVAHEFVTVLKAAGTNPTRAAVMAQTRKLNDPANPFLLPGLTVKTTATERFPIEQALLQRWSKGSWKSFGGLWGYRAG